VFVAALKICTSLNSSSLRYLSTRERDEYTIVLPPDSSVDWDGELGAWFEAMSGDTNILVKGTKKGKYSYYSDIQEGDQLIAIDGHSLEGILFDDAMKAVKARMSALSDMRLRGIPISLTPVASRPILKSQELGILPLRQGRLVLTFRSYEERLRRERIPANGELDVSLKRFSKSSVLGKRQLSRRATTSPSLASQVSQTDSKGKSSPAPKSPSAQLGNSATFKEAALDVSMSIVKQSIFIHVRPFDFKNPPYFVENRSSNRTIYFRQRNCDGHSWNSLPPGSRCCYMWEEPLQPKKLTVRVGPETVVGSAMPRAGMCDAWERSMAQPEGMGSNFAKAKNGLLKTENEESAAFGPSRSIKLEEIGFVDMLPCPVDVNQGGLPHHLFCRIDTKGETRVLVVSDSQSSTNEVRVITDHLCILETVIEKEFKALTKMHAIQRNFLEGSIRPLRNVPEIDSELGEDEDDENVSDTRSGGFRLASDDIGPRLRLASDDNVARLRLASDDTASVATVGTSNRPDACVLDPRQASSMVKDLHEIVDSDESNVIVKPNQLFVQILEATGLKSADISGAANPYCEVKLKNRASVARKLFSAPTGHKTYFCEKSLNPRWTEQKYVFDVPEEAINFARGYAVVVKLRSCELLKKDPLLGRADIQLHALRQQKELTGWYPLKGANQSSNDRVLGSIKLRVQWISTAPALVEYWILLSERRLAGLRRNKSVMEKQVEALKLQTETVHRSMLPNIMKIKKARRNRSGGRKGGQDRLTVERQLPKWRMKIKQPTTEESKATRKSILFSLQTQTLESKRRRTMLYNLEQIRTDQSAKVYRGADVAGQNSLPSSPSSTRLSVGDARSLSFRGELNRQRKTSDISMDSWRKLPMVGGYESRRKVSDMSSEGDRRRKTSDVSFGHVVSPSRYPRLTGFPLSMMRSRKSPNGERLRISEVSDELLHNDSVSSSELLQDRSRFFTSWESLDDDNEDHDNALPGDGDKVVQLADLVATHQKSTKSLFERGLLYHTADWSYHRHLPLFHTSWISSHFGIPTTFPASVQNLSSWNDAAQLLNDRYFANVIRCQRNKRLTLDGRLSEEKIQPSQGTLGKTPQVTTRWFSNREMQVYESKQGLKAFASRSLKMVLNQGGWLTVRPITALNLPELDTMSVKLKYGAIVQMSKSVDAKVTPTWTTEESAPKETPKRQHSQDEEIMDNAIYNKVFRYRDNDLQVFVEHLKTSGILRLSVVGEKVNSDVEVGVLYLPINNALACCNEMIGRNVGDRGNEQDEKVIASSMYVRWFPLKNPKECIPTEGDMGTSLCSKESERTNDEAFTRFHTPCIKLALLWEPDAFEDGLSPTSAEGKMEKSSSENQGSAETRGGAQKPQIKSYFYGNAIGVTASLIDSPRSIELFSVSLEKVDVRYYRTEAKTHLKAALGWLQVDHQSMWAQEPVVLAPRPVSHPQPTIQIIAVKDNTRSKGNVDTFECVAVAIQEMDLRVEETWLFECWIVFLDFIRSRELLKISLLPTESGRDDALLSGSGNAFESYQSTRLLSARVESDCDSMDTRNSPGRPTSLQEITKFYIEAFMLGNLKINVSYIKSVNGAKPFSSLESLEVSPEQDDKKIDSIAANELHESKKKRAADIGLNAINRSSELFRRWSEQDDDDDFWTQGGGRYADRLPDMVSAVFPSIADAPIRIPGKIMEHVFESLPEIASSLRDYYAGNTLRQVYRIIGSLELLGNPRDALSQVATGVKDFFYEPSRAFLLDPKNPTRLGIGVARGTLSLVSHSASGFFGFASRMSSTAGHAAATLSLDKKFLRRRAKFVSSLSKAGEGRRGRKEEIMVAVRRPVQDLLFGIAGAATGIVIEPYRGGKKNGPLGFTKGVAIGIVGIVAKPLVGIFDAVAHTAESISLFADRVNVLEKKYDPVLKRRMPHAFGLNGVLLRFNLEIARSVDLTRRFPPDGRGGRYAEGPDRTIAEVIVHTAVLEKGPGVDVYIIATTSRLLNVRLKRDSSGQLNPALVWQIAFNGSFKIKSRIENRGHNGVVLHLKEFVVSTISSKTSASSRSGQSSSGLPPRIGRSSTEGGSALAAPVLSRWQTLGESRSTRKPERTRGVAVFAVLGEFHQRSQLVRVHNAICCITKSFEGVINEPSLGPLGTKEGITSFGSLSFEPAAGQERNGESMLNTKPNRARGSSLDHLQWISCGESTQSIRCREHTGPEWQLEAIKIYLENVGPRGIPFDVPPARRAGSGTIPIGDLLGLAEMKDPDWFSLSEGPVSAIGTNAPGREGDRSERRGHGRTDTSVSFALESIRSVSFAGSEEVPKQALGRSRGAVAAPPKEAGHQEIGEEPVETANTEPVLATMTEIEESGTEIALRAANAINLQAALACPHSLGVEQASPGVSTMGFDEATVSTRLSKVETMLEELLKNQMRIVDQLALSNLGRTVIRGHDPNPGALQQQLEAPQVLVPQPIARNTETLSPPREELQRPEDQVISTPTMDNSPAGSDNSDTSNEKDLCVAIGNGGGDDDDDSSTSMFDTSMFEEISRDDNVVHTDYEDDDGVFQRGFLEMLQTQTSQGSIFQVEVNKDERKMPGRPGLTQLSSDGFATGHLATVQSGDSSTPSLPNAVSRRIRKDKKKDGTIGSKRSLKSSILRKFASQKEKEAPDK
jgi:hypothetical protein